MDKTLKRGSLEMIAAMLISGTIGWFVLVSGQAVVDVVFWRCVIGGAMLLLVFASYSKASIAISTAVYNVQPFMLVGLAALFLGERITLAKLAWLGVAFLGMLAIVSAHGDTGTSGENYLLGIALALGAALLYAVAALIVKRLSGTPPHLIALIQLLTGILMLAPLASYQLPEQPQAWASLAALGILHTGVMYMLLYSAIQKLPTALTGALSFIYPIAAIFVDWLAFGHRLSPLQWLGVAAILLAAAGMQQGWSLRGVWLQSSR